MKSYRQLVWLILFGSLLGISEVMFGGLLFNENVPYASVFLSAWAFFVLAVARGVINKPGTSTAIGAIAVLFKLINTSPFFCHFLGIFALGVAFDIAATLLIKHERKIICRNSFSGVVGAYVGYPLFALVITYIVRYEIWTIVGSAKVLHHIFVSGSFAALAAIVIVPLGYWIGVSGEILAQRHPRWALGRIVG